MSGNTFLVELMDGITEPRTRTSIARAYSSIVAGYSAGRISDEKLKGILFEFAMDILLAKKPTADLDALKPEAEDWADKLYREIRKATIGLRYQKSSGISEW